MAKQRRLPSRLTRAARFLTLPPAIIVVSLLVTGCLYWVRAVAAAWPGPRVSDALPLDELPGHDSVPLVVFVVFFVLAGAALGLLARWLGLGRLSAGVVLALGTGMWTFAIEALSLFIVRQIAFTQAATAAAQLEPVYLAAFLTGAAGALLARAKASARPRGRPGGAGGPRLSGERTGGRGPGR